MGPVNHERIIHRVWLGPNQPLSRDAAFTDLWQCTHPGWKVMVWDDQAVDSLLRPLIIDELYEQAPTYVHRADIVMVEAIHRFGGLYAGWDTEPTRSWEPLIGGLYGWSTIDVDGFPGGVFGARSGHPAMRALLATIYAGVQRRGTFSTPNVDTGPFAWGATFGLAGRMPGGLEQVGTAKTWAPVHWKQKELLDDPLFIEGLRADPEVFSIHYFNGSWLPESSVDVHVRS